MTATMQPAGATKVAFTLVVTLAIQSAVPPFATDMYTPAFPDVTRDLGTTSTLVGLSMTSFFVGLAIGQLVGGPWSDQRGRRMPLLVGGVICTIGAVAATVAPGIAVLIVARAVQGFGGGVAASTVRAVVVDLAHGDQLAKLMTALMALGGLAPAVAPIAGSVVLTVTGSWRIVLACLILLGVVMVATTLSFVPESLPAERRHAGGLRATIRGMRAVITDRTFGAYAVVSAAAAMAMLAYVADATYVLQEIKGIGALPYGFFFAATALAQVLVTLLSSRIVGRVSPRALVGTGLTITASAVAALGIGVAFLGTPLILTCAAFLLIMAMQGMIFGNASALAVAGVRSDAGAASSLLGVAQAAAMSISAPLATIGGSQSALPMLFVMVAGILVAAVAFRATVRR